MSIHRTLKSNKYGQIRTVRSRRERIKTLLEKEIEVKSVFNLPAEKVIRLKIKEEKQEKPVEAPVDTMTDWTPPTHKKTSKDVGKIK